MDPGRSRTDIPDNRNWGHQATIRREQAPQVMDGDLKPWGLYSLDSAIEPESLSHEGPLHTISHTARQGDEQRIHRRRVAKILVCLHQAMVSELT